MNTSIFIQIVVIHFLADFGLQTHEQAIKKSTSSAWLNMHVGVYSLVWLIANIGILNWYTVPFAMITYACHLITDYVTSRINKKFFDANDLHNGFVGIGFDQMLHYVQLYLTFKLFL